VVNFTPNRKAKLQIKALIMEEIVSVCRYNSITHGASSKAIKLLYADF